VKEDIERTSNVRGQAGIDESRNAQWYADLPRETIRLCKGGNNMEAVIAKYGF